MMFKKIISFFSNHFVALLCFGYSLLFYLGYDMTGVGIKLSKREQFVEHAWFWFYSGVSFFIFVEIFDYYYKSKISGKITEKKESLACLIGRVFFGVCILLHVVNVISNDFISIVCSIAFIIFLIYCLKFKEGKIDVPTSSK